MNKEEIVKNKIYKIIDKISIGEIRKITKKCPSLRGILLGYLAEERFHKLILKNKKINDIRKHDDHDRKNNKADRDFLYKQKHRISVQLKSVQTNSIKWDEKNKRFLATVQNDASCKREITLPNGEKIRTTNYKVGDYDILAVPLYPFCSKWIYAYKLNKNCKKSTYKKYSESQRKYLLSTTEKITYPLEKGWTTNLDTIIKEVVNENNK